MEKPRSCFVEEALMAEEGRLDLLSSKKLVMENSGHDLLPLLFGNGPT